MIVFFDIKEITSYIIIRGERQWLIGFYWPNGLSTFAVDEMLGQSKPIRLQQPLSQEDNVSSESGRESLHCFIKEIAYATGSN